MSAKFVPEKKQSNGSINTFPTNERFKSRNSPIVFSASPLTGGILTHGITTRGKLTQGISTRGNPNSSNHNSPKNLKS